MIAQSNSKRILSVHAMYSLLWDYQTIDGIAKLRQDFIYFFQYRNNERLDRKEMIPGNIFLFFAFVAFFSFNTSAISESFIH